MVNELFKEYKKNLDFFFKNIDIEDTHLILNLFLQCRGTIIFSGVGKSGIIAEKLALTMLSTGTKALYLPPSNALHGDIGIVGEDDLCVFISKSGESIELLELVPYAKNKGAQTIAWVSNPSSRLVDRCHYHIILPFNSEICPFDLAPTTSTAIQLIFGDVLSVALMKKKKFSLDEYALNHPAGSIGKKISLKVGDLMLKDKELPICSPDLPLRDALFEISNKRSGCLLIVDKDQNLLGIFTDGDLRRALQGQATSILEMPISNLMVKNCIAITADLLAWEALKIMQTGRRVMMLPVIEEGKLRGLIRMHDIIYAGIGDITGKLPFSSVSAET